MKELLIKHGFVCSESVIKKANEMVKRTKLVSPLDARGLHFHICPTIEDGEKSGYDVTYLRHCKEWICDCRHEVYRVDREHICSHILAALCYFEEMNE